MTLPAVLGSVVIGTECGGRLIISCPSKGPSISYIGSRHMRASPSTPHPQDGLCRICDGSRVVVLF
jgi:hypothetical protein